MAYLGKQKIVRWVDAAGKRVKAGTAGAVKVVEESRRWYIFYKEGRKTRAVPAYADKAASQKKLADWLRARERGEAELTGPHDASLKRPVGEHLEAYLKALPATATSERYRGQVRAGLEKKVAGCGWQTLRDVDPASLTDYLAGLKVGPATRNAYRRMAVAWFNWLQAVKAWERNPIDRFNVKLAKGRKRRRRALTREEAVKLLAAVRARPLAEAQVNKGGRKPKPGGRPCNLKPATRARLERLGRERWLIYRVALLTALRRGEIAAIKVAHLELDRKPFPRLYLPGDATKNREDARLLLVPDLAADLAAWIRDGGKQPADRLLTVPTSGNLSRQHKLNLQAAGIPFLDAVGRVADFHALRKTANTLLRLAGIPAKDRQRFMRHSKLELTTECYDDDSMVDLEGVVKALAGLGL
jgi:integrase